MIPLLNEKDRLNSTALKIIKIEKENDCILCSSVIKETAKVFRKKLNQAITNAFPILWEINDIEDPFKRDEIILKGFKSLIEKDSNIENFYRLLHTKIVTYINSIGLHTLPRHLSNWVEHVTRTIDDELHKIVNPMVISIDYEDSDDINKCKDIKKITAPIRFKDNIDFDIFCELAIFLSDKTMVDFYTDDKDFCKKCGKAYSLLVKDSFCKETWLKLIHTEDLT